MKGCIFNASPLILLGKIDQLHLVEGLSPAFRIPRAVVAEIGVGPTDDPTIKWLSSASTNRHIVDARQLRPSLHNGISALEKPRSSALHWKTKERQSYSTTLQPENLL